MTIAAGRIDLRTVIVPMTLAIIVSNVIAAAAPSFAIFLIGRLILGVAVGGLWSFAVAVGRRLVPESAGARATSIIAAGISAGAVCGMPVGAVVGDLVGWRLVFAANALLGLLIILAQVRFLPRLPTAVPINFTRLIEFAKVPMARVWLIASASVAGGHFIAYPFLEPYLRYSLAFGQSGVALALAVSSAAAGLFVMAAAILAGASTAAVIMVMLWGFAFGAVPVCVQVWMFTSSPKLYEAGSALMVSAFQIALAAGAAIGGLLVDSSGIGAAFLAAGVVCVAGAFIPLLYRAPDAPPLNPAVAVSGRSQLASLLEPNAPLRPKGTSPHEPS
jgi:predicted MFS family arabinose efflux permease